MDFFYFLRDDFRQLEQRIKDTQTKIEESLKEMGENAQQDANVWHDNFGFEDAQRQAEMWSNQLRELVDMKNRAKIVDPYPKTDRAFIGRTITVQDVVTKEEQKFRIGSFLVLDENSGSVSYTAPLAKIFVGAKVGEIKRGEIAGEDKLFELLKIE